MNTSVKEIFPAEAFAKAKQGTLFVDVREKSELDAEAYDVPNLLHIPLGELELRLNEIPHDQDVIIVCRGGGRSLHALRFLIIQGYINAANMKQGILGWMREGFPVIKNMSQDESNVSCCSPTGFISINQL